MAIDVQGAFERGGRTLLDFLTFCVMAGRLEPVFAYLVREYRIRPTAPGALALFDLFLSPGAPARLVRVAAHLPPRNVRFEMEVERLRPGGGAATGAPATEAGTGDPQDPPPPPPPVPRYLFDSILERMGEEEEDPVLLPGRDFDPALTPVENLPGGRMTEGQRAFLERVWLPEVRPRLVAAGFWRIATVG